MPAVSNVSVTECFLRCHSMETQAIQYVLSRDTVQTISEHDVGQGPRASFSKSEKQSPMSMDIQELLTEKICSFFPL